MIEFKELVKTLETQLNIISDSTPISKQFYWQEKQPFKLFADIADFEHYYRAIDSNSIIKYINCIAEVLTPDLMAYKGLQISTQTVELQFVLDIDMLEKDDDGNFIEVLYVKNMLDKFIATYNGVPFVLTEDETSFEVTPSYSGVTTGIVEQLSPFGRTTVLTITSSFTIVESGVNSNNVTYELDGKELFTSSATITRTRTAETNQNEEEQVTNTIIQSNGINFNFKSPLLNNEIMQIIEQDVLVGGNNIPHLLTYTRNGTTYQYCVVFIENTLSTALASNIGLNYNLAEARKNIVVKNSNVWHKATGDLNFNVESGYLLAVWFKDGTKEYLKNTTGETQTVTRENQGSYIYCYFEF